jgi:hypothetical protein
MASIGLDDVSARARSIPAPEQIASITTATNTRAYLFFIVITL